MVLKWTTSGNSPQWFEQRKVLVCRPYMLMKTDS